MRWEEVTAREKKLKAEFGVVMTRAQINAPLFREHSNIQIYGIVQIIWLGKTLANQSFQSLTRKTLTNLQQLENLTLRCFGESGIWLGKTLANNIGFAKFIKVYPTRGLHYKVATLKMYIASIHMVTLTADTTSMIKSL